MDYDEQLFARMYNLIRVSGKCMYWGKKFFANTYQQSTVNRNHLDHQIGLCLALCDDLFSKQNSLFALH